MDLTEEQKATIKADVLNSIDPAVVAARDSYDDIALATLYNADASPDFWVWKTYVTEEEITNNGLDWTLIDNLTVGKDRVWQWMFKDGGINPSKPNIRAGIDECWKGTSAMLAQREVVKGHCRRKASRVEKLLATGTGSTADPATMGAEGPIGYGLLGLIVRS